MQKKFPVGAIIGAVVGVIAGILIAPKSGKETRADIKRSAEDLKTKAAKTVDDTKVAAVELKDKGVKAVDDTIKDAKKSFKK